MGYLQCLNDLKINRKRLKLENCKNRGSDSQNVIFINVEYYFQIKKAIFIICSCHHVYVRMPIANTTFKGRTYYKGATQWKEGTKLNPCGRLKMRLNYIIYTNLNLKTMQASGHLTWVDWVGCITLADRPHILLTQLLACICLPQFSHLLNTKFH